MRRLTKLECPEVLAQNADHWLTEFHADKENITKRTRYRHKDIKSRLKEETGDKCIYCESKIGHNTPGDIEHKVPTSKVDTQHFTWENLTIACTECNRRKNDFYNEHEGFLDPYMDDVETAVIHFGPLVSWQLGNTRAEISIRTLQLDNDKRRELIFAKIAAINSLKNLVQRYLQVTDPAMKSLLRMAILDAFSIHHEYSGMLRSVYADIEASIQN